MQALGSDTSELSVECQISLKQTLLKLDIRVDSYSLENITVKDYFVGRKRIDMQITFRVVVELGLAKNFVCFVNLQLSFASALKHFVTTHSYFLNRISGMFDEDSIKFFHKQQSTRFRMEIESLKFFSFNFKAFNGRLVMLIINLISLFNQHHCDGKNESDANSIWVRRVHM